MSGDRACPKCGARRVVREGMFHWRGTTFSGLVCEACNGLWDNPEDSFEAHVVADAKRPGLSVRVAEPPSCCFRGNPNTCPEHGEKKMSDHQFRFMSAHGQDAPGMSCDTYDQCVTCGLVRHDYRHGGGQRSPNYPIYLVRGVHSATPPACIGIVSETKGKEPSPLGEDDCG